MSKVVRDGIAVITGGEGDFASAVAQALRDAGRAAVLTPGRRQLDVTDAESVTEYFSGCGDVDLLVNAAGLTCDRALVKLDEQDWDSVLAVNLDGAFRCSRAVLRGMLKRRRGHIVQIGSFSALRPPAAGQAAYAAAKAGLIGLTQSLAAEVGSRGVRVNAVLPGFLETKMTATLPAHVIERVRTEHVLGRFNTPDEAAQFVVALDRMTAVSGQVFQLDSRISRHL